MTGRRASFTLRALLVIPCFALAAPLAAAATEPSTMADVAAWPIDAIDWRKSPVDLSFLNETEKPAGKRGFVKAAGDKLVFEDGTIARFWGANLGAHALFQTSKDNVRQQARRLSALGFNLVRLHHHDSHWVEPNIFGGRAAADTQRLSPAMIDKLDWWVKCLKDEGIYVWLDMEVQRALKAGDRIEGFHELAKSKAEAELKGYNYVNPGIQEAMQRFAEAYLTHLNPYTGLRYKDDPAIAAILLTNENDLTHHFGNRLLPDKQVPWHSARYMAAADDFAAKWGLPKDKTWRSWEDGPAKLFLNDLQHRFDAAMIAHLRGLGVRVPIVTTSYWAGESLNSIPALAAGDMIDVHAYAGSGELGRNPLKGGNLVHWIASARLLGRPLSVSEWNTVDFPSPDRHTLPLYVAAAAGMQGWSALLLFAYAQAPLNDAAGPSNWNAFNDPALLAVLPAAALLYRQGHVREAETVYLYSPTPSQLFDQAVSSENAPALRTASELAKLALALPTTRELPWLAGPVALPGKAVAISDARRPLIAADAVEAVSETGQLRHRWSDGIFTVATPRTQAAMGRLGGRDVALPDVDVALAAKNAVVAVQSLDGRPIAKSRRLMISVAARAQPSGNPHAPYRREPVAGTLSIAAPPGLRLYNKVAASGELRPMATLYRSGRYRITLDRGLDSPWLFLGAAAPQDTSPQSRPAMANPQ